MCVVAEDAAVVMQELGEAVIRVLGLVQLQLATRPHTLPLLLYIQGESKKKWDLKNNGYK